MPWTGSASSPSSTGWSRWRPHRSNQRANTPCVHPDGELASRPIRQSARDRVGQAPVTERAVPPLAGSCPPKPVERLVWWPGPAPHVCDRGGGEERPTTKHSPNFSPTLTDSSSSFGTVVDPLLQFDGAQVCERDAHDEHPVGRFQRIQAQDVTREGVDDEQHLKRDGERHGSDER